MKILVVFVLLFAFVLQSYAVELVLKTKKTVISENTELGLIDSFRYKQIRVIVRYENPQPEAREPKYSLIFNLFAIEDGEQFLFDSFIKIKEYYSTPKATYFNKTFDSPPTKIKVIADTPGDYWLYVYGVR